MTIGGSRPSASRDTRLEFETLISDTSASLFAGPPDQLDRAVRDSLEHVRDFFQADRCGLLSVSADQQVVNVRLASYSHGVSRVPDSVNLTEVFPWSWRILLVERVPVRVSRLADLPPEADVDRQGFVKMATRSSLTIPVETVGTLGHLIVVNTVHRECEWPDALVQRLRVLGEMLVDALERQEMFAGLREAEERLSLAADSAEAGLWELDYETGVFWATEQARAIFGYARDEVVDLRRFEASVHPEDLDAVMRAVRRSRSGEALKIDYRIMTDGGERWVASRGRTRSSSTGKLDRLMGITLDISERAAANQALRASEARLAAGAELAGLAFYEIDWQTGVIPYADDRTRDLLGLPAEGELGAWTSKFWLDHVHPDDRQAVADVRRRLLGGDADRFSVEYRYIHPHRGETWLNQLAAVFARDAHGRATHSYGAYRDITARKRAEAELRELSRRLIGAHEEERAMLARELHDDVSQRLAVLAIEVGRAEQGAQEGVQADVMRAVREGLVRLSEDVHSLAYQLHPSVLEELGLAEALRAECERRGRQGSLDLSVDLDSLPATMGPDAALCLFRVAQEALNNVARHAGVREASITLRRAEGGLLLAVADGGAGFDPTNAARGMRLGLASMRERVRLVHGTLDIDSAPGRGTTVVAWVPLDEGTQ
jgi:PAS domain S-box-containing protein